MCRYDTLEFAEDDVDGVDFRFDVKLGSEISDFTRRLELNLREHVDVLAGETESGFLERIAAFFSDRNRDDLLAIILSKEFVRLAQDVCVERARQAALAGHDDR